MADSTEKEDAFIQKQKEKNELKLKLQARAPACRSRDAFVCRLRQIPQHTSVARANWSTHSAHSRVLWTLLPRCSVLAGSSVLVRLMRGLTSRGGRRRTAMSGNTRPSSGDLSRGRKRYTMCCARRLASAATARLQWSAIAPLWHAPLGGHVSPLSAVEVQVPKQGTEDILKDERMHMMELDPNADPIPLEDADGSVQKFI